MTTTTKFSLAVHLAISAACIFVLLLVLVLTDRGEPAMGMRAPHQCQEDEACWNCETMGNHICGKDAAPAVPVSAGMQGITG